MAGREDTWTLNAPVRVAQEVRRRGVLTRSELSAATGVSVPQLSKLIRGLEKAGFLAQPRPKIGSSNRTQIAGRVGTLVGIDVTLGQFRVALADAAYGLRNRPDDTCTPVVAGDAASTLARIAEVVACEIAAHDVAPTSVIGVGIGLPGPVRREGGVPDSESILPGWSHVPVRDRLEDQLRTRVGHSIRCAVANDASLGALGVFTRTLFRDPLGAPRDLVYVRVTDGIGAGLVLKGHLVTGGSGFAGELGHVRVTSSVPLCPRCGARGCLEARAAAPAIAEEIRAATGVGRPGSMPIETALASSHPARHHATWEAGWLVGMALGQVCNLVNPSLIVVGELITSDDTFMQALCDALGRHSLPQVASTVSVRTWDHLFDGEPVGSESPPDVGDGMSAELLGALAFVLDELGDRYLLPRVEDWHRSGKLAPVS